MALLDFEITWPPEGIVILFQIFIDVDDVD